MINPQSIFPVIAMIIAAIIAGLIALHTWRWRDVQGGVYFILLMMAVSLYSLTASFEAAAMTISAKIIWSKLSYIGVISISPLWLTFAISYSQRSDWLTPFRITALWLLPAVILGLAVTNEWHGLIWSKFTPTSTIPGSRLIYGHGVGFWIHAAYAYALMLAGIYLFVQNTWHSPHLYRQQVRVLIIAAFIPWLGNLLYIFNLDPWPGLDLTPIAFVLTGLLLTRGIYRFQLLDLLPVARDVVFDSISDGVLVLDDQNRLVDINPIACRWTGLGNKAIGHNLFDLLSLDEVVHKYENVEEARTKLEFGDDNGRHVYDLTISPLRDTCGCLQGRVVLLHDISHEQGLLDTEKRRGHQMELLNEITRATLSTKDFQHMLQILADRLGELFDADGAFLTLWNEEQQRTIPATAYGVMRNTYPTLKVKTGEKTMTESVLIAGHVLVAEDAFNTPYLSPRIASLFPTRSMLALPLITNDQKLGAAIISFNQTHHFTPDEIALGEQAGGQIALAIAKAQLYDTESHRVAQLTALHSISQAVVSSLELNQIFNTVVSLLHHTFGYQYVSIYRLYGKTLHLGAQLGYPEKSIYERISVNHGVHGRAVRTLQPQFVRDVTTDPDYLCATNDVMSEICVPLLKKETVLGTLNIESTSQRFLTEADMRLLITFANQVVVAIDNASLFQAERIQRELAEALRDMGIALSEHLEIEIVLDRLLTEIKRVVPYDSACVMLMDKECQCARIARLRDYEQFGEEIVQQVVTLEFEVATTTYLRRMVETSKPMIVDNTTTDPEWITGPASAHISSWVGAPIILRNKVIGFISLDKIEQRFYRPEHAQRLVAFTSQAAIAIENARIFTEIQQRAEKERLLLEATRDFTAGLDTEEVLLAIVRHMVSALDVDGCTVSRWDPANDCVVTLLDYESNIETSFLDGPGNTYTLDDYPHTRSVLESRQPLFLCVDDPSIDSSECTLLKQYEYKALFMLPLAVGQERPVFGLIELFRKVNTLPFSASDIELAQSLSAQAAIAIENARLYAEVQRLAIMDELTGLNNRRGLFRLGQQEVERATRFKHPLTIFFLDIDHFKLFNDTYSYAVGDQVLRKLANCLRANLRDFDLVGRYGGEEFIILLPEVDLQSAREVAERVRHSVEMIRVNTTRGEPSITVSIGVCQKAEGTSDLEVLIDRAGQALHEAKERGRNRVFVM